MDLRPSSEQEQLVIAFADLFGDHATPEAVEAAEASSTPGHDRKLWSRVLEMGAIDMALFDGDEYAASLLDLALVAEQHGRFVVPTPMIEAQVATRLLGRVGALGNVVDPDALSDGSRLVTIALRPARGGSLPLVPAGSVATDVIVLVGEELVLAPLAGNATFVANLGSQPLADVTLADERVVLASGAEAVAAYDLALDEWRILTAAALVGVSARALEIGVEYVKVRKAFGKPVGAFQSVQHKLADRATETDGARLLAYEAAWAADEDPERTCDLAAMALAFCAETAASTSHDSLHFHGGYGFMTEYPIQQYYRRARSWGAVLESPAAGYQRVGRAHLASPELEGTL